MTTTHPSKATASERRAREALNSRASSASVSVDPIPPISAFPAPAALQSTERASAREPSASHRDVRSAAPASSPGSSSLGSSSPGSSSEDLARAIRAGNGDAASRAAFGRLVERHEASLLRFLRSRTASDDDAEELAQEVFLRVWRKLELYDPAQRFSTWLFTLARHVAISRVRVRRERATGTAADATGDLGDAHSELASDADARGRVDDDPSRAVWERERAQGVWALADRVLTPEQREALWLRYAEDLSAEEIGAVLRRSPAAVRVLLFRARTALADHVETYRDGAGGRA